MKGRLGVHVCEEGITILNGVNSLWLPVGKRLLLGAGG